MNHLSTIISQFHSDMGLESKIRVAEIGEPQTLG